MKALLLVGLIFSAFLIFLGVSSRNTTGDVLSTAVIIGGLLVFLFVTVVSIISFVKEKKENED